MTQHTDSSDIRIVIPNLNNAALLRKCLDSLLQQLSPENIIVVDNGSEDNSVSTIATVSKGIIIIRHSENKGFTGGVNAGIEYALEQGAEFIALINNDAVADINWLQNLVDAMKADNRIGIVTSKILLEDKKHLDSTGELMTIWGAPFPRGRYEIDKGQYDNQPEIFGASGGASLYRAEMLREIGIFDDDYFAYFEDVDISFRAHSSNWKVTYEPRAIVYHGLSKTASALGKDFAFYQLVKNYLLLNVRNMPPWLLVKYSPLLTLGVLRLMAGSLARRRPHVFFRAILAAIKLIPNTARRRRDNMRRRKLSTAEIDALLVRRLPPRLSKIETKFKKTEQGS